MARQTIYVPFLKATAISRLHGKDIKPPGMRRIENLFLSRSDLLPALRPNLVRYRDDVHAYSSAWVGTSAEIDDWLNAVALTDDETQTVYFTRVAPFGLAAGVPAPLWSTYSTGLVTTDGSTGRVAVSGASLVANVWAHCFAEFAGSTDWYRISLVESDSVFWVEGVPAAVSGVAYTIHRVHDSERASYPMRFGMMGSAYIYNTCYPRKVDLDMQKSICGPFTIQTAVSEAELGSISAAITLDADLYGVALQTATAVAVGAYGTILTSPDAVTWTRRDAPTNRDLYGVCAVGTDTYVVGAGGTILKSTDLATWVAKTSGVTTDLYGIYYDGSTNIVAVGAAGVVLTSTDGETWTPQTSGVTVDLFAACWNGADLYAIVGGSGAIVTSADLATWAPATSGVTADLRTVVWNGSVFVSGGTLGVAVSSADGATWATLPVGLLVTIYGLAYSGSALFAATSGGVYEGNVASGIDVVSGASSDTRGICGFGTGQFVGVGPDCVRLLRATGLSFSGISFTVGGCRSKMAFSGSVYVFVAERNAAYGSDLTAAFTAVPIPQAVTGYTTYGPYLSSVAYGAGLFVAVGFDTTGSDGYTYVRNVGVVTSPDGITWTRRAVSQSNETAVDICYANSIFVLVTDAGRIMSSTDGISWTSRDAGNPVLYTVRWSAAISKFVAVGDAGAVITSSNGTAWTTETSGVTYPLMDVADDGTTVVACGPSGVIYSTDGSSWSAGSGGAGSSVVFDGSRFISGYSYTSGTVTYSSSDGATWTAVGVTIAAGNYWTGQHGMSVINGKVVLVNSSGYGSLGSVWNQEGATDTRASGAIARLGKIGSTWYAAGVDGSLFVSTDLVTWARKAAPTWLDLTGIAGIGTVGVLVGAAGTVISYDPASDTLTHIFTAITADLNDVCSNGTDLYVAVGDGGVIYTSPDRVNWTPQTSGTSEDLLRVAWVNSLFVAVGTNGVILTSTDGATWDTETSGSTEDLYDVVWSSDLSLYIVCGTTSELLTSANHTTWAAQTTGITADLRGLVIAGSYVYAFGAAGEVIESAAVVATPPASAWTERTSRLSGAIVTGGYVTGTSKVFLVSGTSTSRMQAGVLTGTFAPVSAIYRAQAFCVFKGYNLLFGTSELEEGKWVYYPRRMRVSDPGTIGVFDEDVDENTGLLATWYDYPGPGQFLDVAPLANTVLVAESQGISVVSPTDNSDDPFSYTMLDESKTALSNLCVANGIGFWVGEDGLLYNCNGLQISPLDSMFDLNEYTDVENLDDPVQLVWDPTLQVLEVFRPTATGPYTVHCVEPVTGAHSTIVLPGLTQGSSVNYPRSLVTVLTRETPPVEDPLIAENVDYVVISRPNGVDVDMHAVGSDGAGTILAAGDTGQFFTTTDEALTWVQEQLPALRNRSRAVEYLDGSWVIAQQGSAVLIGADPSNLTAVDLSTTGLPDGAFALATNGTRLVVGCDDGLAYCDNLGSFSAGAAGSAKWYGAAWTGAIFVAVGQGGAVATASDGETWTVTASGVAQDLNDVAYSEALDLLVAVGMAGTVLRSADDGANWTADSLPGAITPDLYGVTWTGASFIATGENKTVLRSVDGITWVVVNPTFDPASNHKYYRARSINGVVYIPASADETGGW